MARAFVIIFALLLSACQTVPAGRELYDHAVKINEEVNQQKYIAEKKDRWKTPEEFYADGGGDCEDFAIAKCYALRDLGVSSYLVVGKHKKTKEHHAVLWVDGDILDNNRRRPYGDDVFVEQYKIVASFDDCGEFAIKNEKGSAALIARGK